LIPFVKDDGVLSTFPEMKAMAQRSWKRGEAMEWTEWPDPEPGSNEIRVRVKAIGVNPVDWKMRDQGLLRIAAQWMGPPPPVVIGIDFAGIVDAVGRDVTTVKVGDCVVGGTNFSRKQRGSYADTVIVQPDQVAVLPDGFDLTYAGALPVAGVTAWMSIVEIGRLQPGQKALILGASGGVGQFAIQVAKLRGGIAVGVCSTRNIDRVRALGADEVLDYSKGDALDQARVLAPFQVVVDCVGGYSGRKCRSLLASGGRHIMVAGNSPGALLNLLVPPFSTRSVLGRVTGERLKPLVDAVATGAIRVHVSEVLPLAEAEKAHTLSQTGRMAGKIVLVP
jgi:NADPH:quinone reductase-like Zn-dependent oxidoreductase